MLYIQAAYHRNQSLVSIFQPLIFPKSSMCGIFAYTGSKQAAPILLEGLRTLEYRGYDSAGLHIPQSGTFKAVGPVAILAEKVPQNLSGHAGIAHTRWATHGLPTEANAHPHGDSTGTLWLVHNGIIENYRELRLELETKGHHFQSETDTEVLVRLIEETSTTDGDLAHRVTESLKRVRGTYGIAVMSDCEPDTIFVARMGSPIAIGVGNGEYVVASDAAPIVRHTRDIIYLNDGECAFVSPHGHRIFTLALDALERLPEHTDWDMADVKKGGHAHFMHKEIFEIPEAIENSMRGRLLPEEGRAKLGGLESAKQTLRETKQILITGCGTAYAAGRIAEYMLEEYAGVPVETDVASEFRYRKSAVAPHDLLLAVSQSGETADTLAAVKEAKEKGLSTMGIVNVVGSTIARETDFGVYNHVGPEISVASTKAFVSQLVISTLFTLFMGRMRDMSLVTGKHIAEELAELPALVRSVLAREGEIKKVAEHYASTSHMLTLGRKYNAPLATEAAIKFKEICYIPAIDLPAGEIKHGTIALIDAQFPTLAIAPCDSVYEKMKSNIEEIRARGGPIIAITTEGNTELADITEEVLYIPKTFEMLTPILAVVPIYLLAYHIAVLKGHTVDRPRNLAKSVTVE